MSKGVSTPAFERQFASTSAASMAGVRPLHEHPFS